MKVSFNFSFVSIPLNYMYGALSPWQHGSTTLTLADNLQQQIDNLVAQNDKSQSAVDALMLQAKSYQDAIAKMSKGLFDGAPEQEPENVDYFKKPEIGVPVTCDVHPWMFAYIGVLDHPYFAVTDKDGVNQMHNGLGELSEVARRMIAGLTANANALTALTNPTVNAFKRLGPDTLAPFRANWGYDNRSCMVRVPPERGQGTRLEVRVGDGAANPYLVIAGILAAALDGIKRGLDCPDDAVGMAYDNEAAPELPATFTAALDALEANANLHEQLSKELVEVFLVMKRDEIRRYEEAVSDPSTRDVTQWEVDEYFADY